ncbi:hypothetical protein [Dehalobacterium formicoaceticum]|uniref:Uncharacterized protein n=1 Tax=Dehalobacterium formicoaceticum TaxID=51515 RepID=A0ABT1Y174_9FIRM|nr:hypothetical protein [Dehalobacterium formicoaceticum]MCR6544608.1 hypothetical protein [Dehalobacterium formicoaceticum]
MFFKGKAGKKRFSERMHLVSNLLGSASKENLDGISEPTEAAKVEVPDQVNLKSDD